MIWIYFVKRPIIGSRHQVSAHVRQKSTNPLKRRGVRTGTATRKAGQATAARIVQAAHELLETQNYERFSLRNVAELAGVNLANLQYYFPHREDLAKAMSLDVGIRYRAAYEICLEGAPADPVERFKVVLRHNMQDISNKSTRRFFVQFWALLGTLDNFNGRYLEELYAIDIYQLSEHIKAIQPTLTEQELERRATLIASMIEGLLVVTGDLRKNQALRNMLYEEAFDQALGIACKK
jgi:AcrR family transcriptional regulator